MLTLEGGRAGGREGGRAGGREGGREPCAEVNVSCCSLDWQRVPGQERRPSDDIVHFQRRVDGLQVTVSLLEGRPPGERHSHWSRDVAETRNALNQAKEQLLEARREGESQQ